MTEAKKTIDFESWTFDIAHKIITSGAIEKGLVPEILQAERYSKKDDCQPDVYPDDGDLLIRSKAALEEVENGFLQSKLFPNSLIEDTKKLITVDDIIIANEDAASYWPWQIHTFPPKGTSKAKLVMGKGYAYGWMGDRIRRAASTSDTQLSDDQVVDLALRHGVAHEYGHAVQHAVEIIKTEHELSSMPNGYPPFVFLDVQSGFARDIHKVIAPNKDAHYLYENSGGFDSEFQFNDLIGFGHERFATQVGYSGLVNALTEMGLDSSQASNFMNSIRSFDQFYLHKILLLGETLSSVNLNYHQFNSMLGKIHFDEELAAIRNKTQQRFDLLHFGISQAAYGLPLTESQLKEVFSYIGE